MSTHARTYASTHASTHTCTRARTHACMYACLHARLHTFTHTCKHARSYASKHARMRVHTRTHAHAHAFMHTRVRTLAVCGCVSGFGACAMVAATVASYSSNQSAQAQTFVHACVQAHACTLERLHACMCAGVTTSARPNCTHACVRVVCRGRGAVSSGVGGQEGRPLIGIQPFRVARVCSFVCASVQCNRTPGLAEHLGWN